MTSPDAANAGPVLVTGASGFIGRHVLAALLRRGETPVALVRDPDRCGIDAEFVRLIQGDITDRLALRPAVREARAVVHLAAATQESKREVAWRVNVDGTRALIDACTEAGVRRIVAMSTLTVVRRRVGAYGASKREMERLVLQSGLEGVILRPSLVYGPGEGGLFHRMVKLIETFPVVPLIGGGTQVVQPVHVDDVVEAIDRCLQSADVVGRSYDLVGPDDVTLKDLLAMIGKTLGLDRRYIRVPVSIALLGARSLSVLMKEPPITVDNVIGAHQPTPSDRERTRQELGVLGIPLAEGLPSVLDPAPALDPTAQRPLRIAVVGLGKMGVAHSALLSMIPGVRVAAGVDVAPRLGRAWRGMGFRAPWFASLAEALAAVRPDGVVISTPTHTHAELAQLAAAHGVGFLVEKPLAHTFDAARSIADAVAASGIPGSCGYCLAYFPTFEKAKQLLDAGVVGPVERFFGSMFISQVFGPKRGWMYDQAKAGGGVLPNVASHLLFLLWWYFGKVAEVKATLRRLHGSVEDEAELELRFARGVRGSVETSWSRRGYPLSKTTIRAEGPNGSLEVDNDSLLAMLAAPAAGLPSGSTRLQLADLPQPARFNLGGDGYFRQDEEFVASLRGGPAARTSIAGALHVQAVIDAAYRSAEAGGVARPLGAVSVEATAD